MREIFSLGKLTGICKSHAFFTSVFTSLFTSHVRGTFHRVDNLHFFLEILKKISPVRSAELPKMAISKIVRAGKTTDPDLTF